MKRQGTPKKITAAVTTPKKLTPVAVRKLKTGPGERQRDVKDAAAPGLYLRLYRSGRRAWVLRYRFRGRVRVLTLGEAGEVGALSLPEARDKAAQARARLREGLDPAAERQRAKAEALRTPSVGEFAAEYIEAHAKPAKRSWKEDARILEREVLPHLGLLRLDEIHRRDVVALIDAVRGRGKQIMANRTLAVIRKMFNFAIERGALEASPIVRIRALPERPRERILTDEEIRLLWRATGPPGSEGAFPLGPSRRLALRLLLLTGARPGEVAGMEKGELDLEAGRWVLPGARSKNRFSHVVPLAPLARAVLEEALEASGAERWVFPSPGGERPTLVTSVNRALAGIFAGREDRPQLRDVRRTVATRLGALGVPRFVQDRLLNHKDRGIGAVYDRHAYEGEKRRALLRWERALQALLEGGEGESKVVSITGGREGA